MGAIDYQEAIAYNGGEIADGDFTREMIVRLVQEWQETHQLGVDGKCGPNTQKSITSHLPVVQPEPRLWTPWDGPLETQPRNRTEVYDMFGTPGDEGSRWFKENIVEVQGQNCFPGVPPKWYVKVHRDTEPYWREGLRRAMVSSPYKIERFGGFFYRHIQFNEKLPLSYHSWGLAGDIDRRKNKAVSFPNGDGPKPWTPEWMRIWPNGVDEQFVLAMANCGFFWGGWWRRFVDPMHFQFVGAARV